MTTHIERCGLAAVLLLGVCVSARAAGPPAPLLDHSYSPAIATNPIATGSDVGKAPHVGLRFGVHDGFDRLVLEWGELVHARIRVERGTVVVTFNPAGSIDAKRLNDLVPANMRPVKVHADGTQLSFQIPAGRSVRDHSDGKLVVIDLVADSGGIDQSPPAEAAPPPPAAPVVATTKPGRPRPPASAESPDTLAGGGQAPPPQASSQDGFSEVALADTADQQLQISAAPVQDGFSFRFKWADHVKASIFKLRNTVWIVFGRPEHVSFNPEAAGAEHIPVLTQVSNASATILRLSAAQKTRLVTNRTDSTWIVDVLQPTSAQDAADDAAADRVLVKTGGVYQTKAPGQPVTIVDPDSDEILLAVPIFTAGKHFQGSTDNHTYIALPTSQGMLFRPEGDLARFLIEPDGVRVVNAVPTLTTEQ